MSDAFRQPTSVSSGGARSVRCLALRCVALRCVALRSPLLPTARRCVALRCVPFGAASSSSSSSLMAVLGVAGVSARKTRVHRHRVRCARSPPSPPTNLLRTRLRRNQPKQSVDPNANANAGCLLSMLRIVRLRVRSFVGGGGT